MANDFLAGTAFIDTNQNGQLDMDESYLPGATIELRSANGGTLIETKVTDSQGAYVFEQLSPGDYKLVNRSAPDYAGSAAQAISGIGPVTSSTVNSINVTLRGPADLQARVDMDQFINVVGIFEDVTISIDNNAITTSIGQLPAQLYGSTLNPNPSAEFLTLSTDLYHRLGPGVNGPYAVDAGLQPVGSGSPHNSGRVAYLFNHYGREQLGAADAAGLQLAIWELLYDADSPDSVGDLNGGDFQVQNASADAINQAKFYLTDSLNKSEVAIFLNVPSQTSAPSTSLLVGGTFNFANVQAAKIGDLVWHDTLVNGRHEPFEPGIPNATVNLYQGIDLVATTTTDSNGLYLFDHLLAGTYKVEFLLPAGYTQTSTANIAPDDVDSDGPLTGNIIVAAGQLNDTVDQGFYKLASLGDFVWHDRNGNGFQEPGEEGISGARVNLRKSGSVIDTTLTNNQGQYRFDNVQPGVYDVEFLQPVGYAYISPQGQESGALDSDGPYAADVNLESGENDNKIDQGFYGAGRVGNFVWHDRNADGVQDPDEPGIDGVTVQLLKGSTVFATTQTANGGLYTFEVAPGTYSVKFLQPAAYSEISPTDAISDDTRDSDGLLAGTVTVASDGTYNSFDVGFYNKVSIGDFVWHDLNANGIQDTGESGIDNVIVNLVNGSTVVDTTVTSGGGFYSFNAAPGVYTVQFTKPSEYNNVSPSNATDDDKDSDGLNPTVALLSGAPNPDIDLGLFRLIKVGNFVWHDLDADGIQDSGENGIDGVSVSLLQGDTVIASTITANGGAYSFSVLPGTYSVRFAKPEGFNRASQDDNNGDSTTTAPITVRSGDSNNNLDQGFYILSHVGNFVWHDLNANGIQDADEPGIEGVAVSLMQGDTVVASGLTNSEGLYEFAIAPGTYSVKFTKPGNYTNVSPTDATNDLADSDGLSTRLTTVISGETDNALDLGLFNLAKITNFVWHDLDADGVQDIDEPGIDGVSIALMQGLNEVASAVTAGGGLYTFNVIPGTYSVKFTKPTTFTNLSPVDATNDMADSDGLNTASVTVPSGQTYSDFDLGLFNLAKIGNFVWNDQDADGIQDSGEPGIDGVAVSLMQGTTEISTTITAGGGQYTFDAVPGTYTVKFAKPASYTNVSPTDATSDDLDSDGLLTPAVTVISGQSNNSLDQGFYNVASNVCLTIDMQGNTATSGTYGNVRTFTTGGVSVNASAFSRTSAGAWSTAYLGSYGGGLGVTDSSEDGSSTTHTVDNTGRNNYVLFEFSQQVLVDSAFLGYVVTDSDMTVWIGNVNNAFTSHQTLSDAFLSGLGFTEVNTTTSTSARTADINAGGLRGNILVIAAQVDDTSPEDYFKIANLTVCVPAGPTNASVGDLVWYDVNGNGLQDGVEPGIPGATVTLIGGGSDTLINGVGDTSVTTTTDSAGKYSFANLTAGTEYKVTFSVPTGYDAATARKVGANRALDSDGLTSDVFVLASAENNTSIDAGFYKYARVGNFVWNDLDRDGLQDAGELGIGGVQLTLSGTSASGASVSQSTTTASNGSYHFQTLAPGNYSVSIAASNFTSGGALFNFTASPTGVGTNRDLDSNAQPASSTLATSAASDLSVDFGYYSTTALACVTLKMEGNSATSGATGNIRTFSAGGISVKASAFSRDSWGFWSNAYLGSFPGGLGVTDTSEGSGTGSTHTVDNVGRQNYILFEFSQTVTIDSAFLGYVVTDSDLKAWIGTATDPFNNHRNLNDSYLNGLGYSENNDTSLTTTRTADLNATNRSGNVLVISAATSGTINDYFKIAELTLCATVPANSVGTKFFVVDDAADKTFKYTSAAQYTSNFAVGPTSPTGIAADPSGNNTWVSEVSGKVFKYDSNGVPSSNWNTGITGTQGVSTNGTSIWTVSSSTDRVYFYSGAASFVPSGIKPNPTLTSSFALHLSNTNPKDLATDGTTVWVVDDSTVDMIYAYTVSGSYLGRWQLDAANSKPTGITIDPTGGSKIWVVDAGTDKIYEYSGATGCRSGGLLASKTYSLNTTLGNTNPQGIADPPTADDNLVEEALMASQLVDGSFVNPNVNPYYNVLNATDVTDDGLTTALDALVIINRLNAGTAGKLSLDAVSNGLRLDLADVNNDGTLSPLDALLVINRLNQGASSPQSPEAVDAVFGDLTSSDGTGDGVAAIDDTTSGTTPEGEMDASMFPFDAETNLRRQRQNLAG